MLDKLKEIFDTDKRVQFTMFGKDIYLDFNASTVCNGRDIRIEEDWLDGYRIYAGRVSFDMCNSDNYKIVETSEDCFEIRSKENDDVMLFISVWGDEL